MPQFASTRESAPVAAARRGADVTTFGTLGNWELVGRLGRGGLAQVYRARPAGGNLYAPASYAVKVLRDEWQNDPRGVGLLAREFHVSRKVANPHLVPILAAQLTVPPYYLAMPLLEGVTLADRLSSEATIDLPVAFWIVRQVAEALGALHRGGWMHSDVKPSNTFVSPAGHVTLIDLSFARHVDERARIADRVVLGTVSYMAPEMLSNGVGGDIRSDVYSLGVTLFEVLTGRLPFDAQDVAQLALQHRQDVPGDLRALVPHVPLRAARLVHQMLAKEPLRRPLPDELIDRLAALEIETFAERFALA